MCLHVVQGLSFAKIVECLDSGNAIWIAVGGAREMNPYIRKVHTGAARIALQAARPGCEVLLVPLHMAFEAHCQFNSAVLVELGKPVHVVQGLDPDSVQGREEVHHLMAALRENLLPLTNWIPASLDVDYGKKGTRGVGQTRLAVSEWYQIRIIDTLVCLHAWSLDFGALPWPVRVQQVRAVAQHLSQQESSKTSKGCKDHQRFQQARNAFGNFAACVQQEGNLFCGATGTYWDMPVSLKAIPRRNPSEVPNLTLAALRNFCDGPLRYAKRSKSGVHNLPAFCADSFEVLVAEATRFVDSLALAGSKRMSVLLVRKYDLLASCGILWLCFKRGVTRN